MVAAQQEVSGPIVRRSPVRNAYPGPRRRLERGPDRDNGRPEEPSPNSTALPLTDSLGSSTSGLQSDTLRGSNGENQSSCKTMSIPSILFNHLIISPKGAVIHIIPKGLCTPSVDKYRRTFFADPGQVCHGPNPVLTKDRKDRSTSP